MKIKVCGIADNEDLLSIAGYGVDYAGFIFVSSSPRYAAGKIDPLIVQETTGRFPSLKKIGIFLDEKTDVVENAIELYQLNAVQLHGKESREECERLRKRAEVIKTIPVAGADSFEKTKNYDGAVDYFLFETSGPLAGGNGFAFDWNLLGSYTGATPFFLSGGIGPSDTIRISELNHPRLVGVDVNSKFELYPGKKNLVTVNTFINNIKNGISEVRSL